VVISIYIHKLKYIRIIHFDSKCSIFSIQNIKRKLQREKNNILRLRSDIHCEHSKSMMHITYAIER